MNSKDATFVFKSYESDLISGAVSFHYQLITSSKKVDFTETISFSPPSNSIPSDILAPVLESLFLALGISYFKTYCPKNIVIEQFSLSKEQAQFWNTVYTKGLGEFFYKNKIDYRGLVQFPYGETKASQPVSFPRQNRSLVPLGGGKDSIVSVELLKKHNKSFDLLTFSSSVIQEAVAEVIGKKPLVIKRMMDQKLFALNKQSGVYNGHIPVSAIYAFIGLFAALLYDYCFVVVSNEKSANYGNTEYLGQIINHQWSKSEEFEKLFSEYVSTFITKDITYFSLLRPLNEIKIAQLFVKYRQYFSVSSSCNRNFTITKSQNNRWCGRCAKCCFVFTILAAFLPKKDILAIFSKNLFSDESLLPIFQELLGQVVVKPFDCVGTPEEMKLALFYASQNKDYANEFIVSLFAKQVLPTVNATLLEKELLSIRPQNTIPNEFKNVLHK